MTKPDGYWDVFENVAEVAKKYKTRSEFHFSEDGGGYDGALRNGWLDELFPINGNRVWTYEKCKEVAAQCSTRGELRNRYVGAYGAARKNGWLDELIPNSRNKHPINYWNDKERCREEASKYIGRNEFVKKSPTAYYYSRINGWLDEFFGIETLPPIAKSLIQHWTDETCIEEMKKYKNRTEFSRRKPACHKYAKEHNLLEIVYGKAWSKK